MIVRKLSMSAAMLALFACSRAPGDSGEGLLETEQPIIGGAPTNDSKYAAVGALVVGFAYGEETFTVDMHCSGTLVASRAVLTARHCTPLIDALAGDPYFQVYFATGADVWNPESLTLITGYVAAPPSPSQPGLLFDGGRDVAVAYLDSAPDGIQPVQIGYFEDSMLGTRFEIVGYGRHDATPWSVGVKYAGLATARAIGGAWYPQLFDGKQEYLEWYFEDAVTQTPSLAEADAWYTGFILEGGYELLAGGLEDEAVSCFGDSGGPLLLGSTTQDLAVYAVGFAGEASQARGCDLGGAYAVLKQHKLAAFVENAIALSP